MAATAPYWLGTTPTTSLTLATNTATIDNVTINPVPVILVNTNTATNTTLPTTGFPLTLNPASPTLAAGTYLASAEIVFSAPGGAGWAATDWISLTIQGAVGGDSIINRWQPFYVTGALYPLYFSVSGIISFTTDTTLQVKVTYNLAGNATPTTYSVFSVAYQKIA
jgi:hypothetical protein